MDGRGPARVRAGHPGDDARGHDRPLGRDDGRDRSAAQDRPPADHLLDGRHVRLPRISPFAVSIIAGIGKEFVTGEVLDEALDEAVAELVAEAMAD